MVYAWEILACGKQRLFIQLSEIIFVKSFVKLYNRITLCKYACTVCRDWCGGGAFQSSIRTLMRTENVRRAIKRCKEELERWQEGAELSQRDTELPIWFISKHNDVTAAKVLARRSHLFSHFFWGGILCLFGFFAALPNANRADFHRFQKVKCAVVCRGVIGAIILRFLIQKGGRAVKLPDN